MSYQVPQSELCDEQVIKKSRFITHIARATNKAEAMLYIQSIKAQYPDARHHCWAYIAGHPTATIDKVLAMMVSHQAQQENPS